MVNISVIKKQTDNSEKEEDLQSMDIWKMIEVEKNMSNLRSTNELESTYESVSNFLIILV